LIFATSACLNIVVSLPSEWLFGPAGTCTAVTSICFLWPRSTMDSIRVSEAPDPGSIPGEATIFSAMFYANFWNNQYETNNTRWDLGQASPPLVAYIDQLANKNQRILIPGCGNCYEAETLLQKGFTNITIIDIAEKPVEKLQQLFAANPYIQIIKADVFDHVGEYDLVLEQTFFCAIDPAMRQQYVSKMYNLLATNGKIVGVLFNRQFDQYGPPYGGDIEEYQKLFRKYFHIKTMEVCYNSFSKRQETEVFIIMIKR
jgi:methyl halide transferase